MEKERPSPSDLARLRKDQLRTEEQTAPRSTAKVIGVAVLVAAFIALVVWAIAS